jgi:hypothetical protein
MFNSYFVAKYILLHYYPQFDTLLFEMKQRMSKRFL